MWKKSSKTGGHGTFGNIELLQSQVAKGTQNLHHMGSPIPRRAGTMTRTSHSPQLLVPDLDRKVILPLFYRWVRYGRGWV